MTSDDAAMRADGEPSPARLMTAARNVLAARRALQGVLPPDLVHNPALELLIALFVADAGPMPLDEALRSASVSPAVAGRWVAALAAEGLVARQDEALALTEAGRARVADTLRAIIRSQAELPAE